MSPPLFSFRKSRTGFCSSCLASGRKLLEEIPHPPSPFSFLLSGCSLLRKKVFPLFRRRRERTSRPFAEATPLFLLLQRGSSFFAIEDLPECPSLSFWQTAQDRQKKFPPPQQKNRKECTSLHILSPLQEVGFARCMGFTSLSPPPSPSRLRRGERRGSFFPPLYTKIKSDSLFFTGLIGDRRYKPCISPGLSPLFSCPSETF